MLSQTYNFVIAVNYFSNFKIKSNTMPVNKQAADIPFQSNSLPSNCYITRNLLIKIQYIFLVLLQTRCSSSPLQRHRFWKTMSKQALQITTFIDNFLKKKKSFVLIVNSCGLRSISLWSMWQITKEYFVRKRSHVSFGPQNLPCLNSHHYRCTRSPPSCHGG